MTKGEKYHTFYKNKKTGYVQVIEAVWEGSSVDYRREDEGRVFKTQAEAVQASKG